MAATSGIDFRTGVLRGSRSSVCYAAIGVVEMPLFHVQDADRPGYVVAMNYSAAESKWREAVAKENDGEDTGPPDGIALVCDDSDLIVGQDWSA